MVESYFVSSLKVSQFLLCENGVGKQGSDIFLMAPPLFITLLFLSEFHFGAASEFVLDITHSPSYDSKMSWEIWRFV